MTLAEPTSDDCPHPPPDATPPEPRARFPFNPAWMSCPPCETVQEVMDEKQLTPEDLAEKAGLDLEVVRLLLANDHSITPLIASKLEVATEVPFTLWLNLQNIYDKSRVLLELEADTDPAHACARVLERHRALWESLTEPMDRLRAVCALTIDAFQEFQRHFHAAQEAHEDNEAGTSVPA